MITFEIYSEIAQLPSWEVTLYFEEFLIGALSICDLKLPRSSATSTVLKAKQTHKGLILKGHNQDYFWVNGKKIQGSKLVLPKEQIKIGQTTFVIKENRFDKVKHVFNASDQYDHFAQEKSSYLPILEAIEKEVLYAEDTVITPNPDSQLIYKE